MNSLEQLAMDSGDIHWSCDLMMKNFKIRQAMSDAEVDPREAVKVQLTDVWQ